MSESHPLERFAGDQLPPWNWYSDPAERHSYLRNDSTSPSNTGSPRGYSHTLLFASNITSSHLLLGHKNRGFGANTHNGIGGKVQTRETPLQCILRETHEEIGVTLSPKDVHFAGRVRISVDGGEKVCIALYTASFDEAMVARVTGSEEIEPTWYDVGGVSRGEWWETLPERMRPEHRVYLGILLGCHVQGQGRVLVDVQVDFDAEPRKEDLEEGERPENHRTVCRWSLDVLPSPCAADLAAG